jgi:hypothetical protein
MFAPTTTVLVLTLVGFAEVGFVSAGKLEQGTLNAQIVRGWFVHADGLFKRATFVVQCAAVWDIYRSTWVKRKH